MVNGYENEDDYIRSLKKNDTYRFSYNYEIIVNRFGEGNDDVELANAIVNIIVSWDDSSVPGYIISWNVDAPISLPNEWNDSKEKIVEDVCVRYLYSDLRANGISSETFKFL
ncbi:hypothetical protein M3194_29830 [Paenibacillus glycanilyticus]|uniref:hypothetical protein n=1 Tax=Paenibacillus glycanilyticus TaxID=126569 RepID=UPI00203E1A75|nr:hypothetical protein [Paenibacillus glycanilyticus]MCM3631500.1 hypothetical protein [Paenibacillus glycanilyticus]